MTPSQAVPASTWAEARKGYLIAAGAVSLLCAMVLDIAHGPAEYTLAETIAALLKPNAEGDQTATVVWLIRMPASVMAALVGAALGLAGAGMQTILNNPLASPYTLGLSAAAGFGAAAAIIAGAGTLLPGGMAVPLAAFAGALLACAGIYAIALVRDLSAETMVLAGIAVLFLFQSLQALMQFFASPELLQQIVFWLFGSMSRATWPRAAIVAVVLSTCLPLLIRDAWALTALRLGDERAQALGVKVASVRVRTFVLISAITAAAVAFVGTIGFVGLVAPHIARAMVGEDQRFTLILSSIIGAVLLSLSSLASKLVIPGAVFPIGIVTAIFGVPVFLLVVVRGRRGAW